MEKKYFIVVDGSPQGPFTPDELKDRGLKADSRIYVKGWTEFRDAADVGELAPYITAAAAPESPFRPSPSPDTATPDAATSAASAAPAAADISEKEVLMQIMKHLDSLQRENRELRREMENLRHGGDAKVGTSSDPSHAPYMPPPFPGTTPPENVARIPKPTSTPNSTPTAKEPTPKADETAKEEWDKEWKSANSDSTDKKSGNNGFLILLIIVLAVIFIISTIFIASKTGCSRSDNYTAFDSESLIETEVVATECVDSMPAAEAADAVPDSEATGYPYDYYEDKPR